MTQPLVGKQILIVEDEQVFRSLLDSWFSSLGATTVLAADGVDALELLGGFTPDLMICDIAMPRMNGLKLLEHIRNRGDQTPVLVISATENMADIAKALRLGVEDVLLKPVKDLNRLREMVFACLYPSMFKSRVEEEERLFRDWDAIPAWCLILPHFRKTIWHFIALMSPELDIMAYLLPCYYAHCLTDYYRNSLHTKINGCQSWARY